MTNASVPRDNKTHADSSKHDTTHFWFLLSKCQVWREEKHQVMSLIREELWMSAESVLMCLLRRVRDEWDELVLLIVCWSLKRWSGCVGHWQTETHERRWRWAETETESALNELAHSSVSCWGCFLDTVSSFHESVWHSPLTANHTVKPWNITHTEPKQGSSEAAECCETLWIFKQLCCFIFNM